MNVADVRAGVDVDCAVFASPCAVLAAGHTPCVLLDKQMSWRIRDCCHRPDGKSPACSLTWRLCLCYLSICVFSCPGISWRWVHWDERWMIPKVTWLCGTLHCRCQLGTKPSWWKTQHHRAESAPSRTQTWNWRHLKALFSAHILSLYLNSIATVLCWKSHGHQEGSLSLGAVSPVLFVLN